MSKFYLIKVFFNGLALICSGMISLAQCPIGSSAANINWDNLDYLSRTGTYSTFVTTAMTQTQHFTIGKNRLTINYPNSISTNGDNTTNTAEAGSFGAGADVEYNGNGIITIIFDEVVYNLQFSIYDIDAAQSISVSAEDGSAIPMALNINMNRLTAGVITVTGNSTPMATATANNTAVGNADTRGTLNISITGSDPLAAKGIKKVTLTIGGIGGNYWMSDLSACVFGSFPTNYYMSQQPFTGQPSYYMVTPDNNSVYLMNPLTGVSQWLFSEPASPWINSMAYDPINKVLYYIMDNPTPKSTNKSVKKYDFNTETISTIIPDVTSFGIPLFDIVVESAGADFYNGSLFLGVEGTNGAKNSNRESIIWRIDFDAALNPTRASQAFGRPADNGSGTLTHDWGDFTIKDGILYDFNTGNVGSTSQYIHYDMQSGDAAFYNTGGNPAPIQAGQTWDGKIYWTGGQAPELGRVAIYNENGTIGAKIVASVTACSPAWVGRAGDASDPFRPKSDFGDAPGSYDPIHLEKATHEYDCNLRLGLLYDREWDKTASPTATADGNDEDGINTVTVLSKGVSNFVQDIRVYNNTGSNATLAGWLDYNGNGIFDPGEGRTITVPSSAATQTVTLSWMGISVSLIPGTNTFLRTRITSAANNMTINNATRWFANGEVEDYMVFVDMILPVKVLRFTATPERNDRVLLGWKTDIEINFRGFDIERSIDGKVWKKMAFVAGYNNTTASNSYSAYDTDPVAGKSYYRLKLISLDESYHYSETRVVELNSKNTWMTISPNPVRSHALLQYNLDKNETVSILVIDTKGRTVIRKTVSSSRGLNQQPMNEVNSLAPGMYIVRIVTADEIMSTKLIKQ